jgi:hypothetical protein
MKGCDKEGGVVIEGVVPRDSEQEVFVNILVLWTPDFFATFVDDGILMRVVSNSGGARRGSEEMREELGFRGDGEWEVEEDRSGWGRRGNDGNGGFNDGWRKVLDGDIGEGDSLDNFFKLKMDVCVLMLGDQGVLKLGAYDVSLFSGDVGEDMEEVGQCGNDGGRGMGTVDVDVGGGMIATWAG